MKNSDMNPFTNITGMATNITTILVIFTEEGKAYGQAFISRN